MSLHKKIQVVEIDFDGYLAIRDARNPDEVRFYPLGIEGDTNRLVGVAAATGLWTELLGRTLDELDRSV